MDSYGMRIKALREAAGLTQEQFGKKIGTSGVTIMRYERGQRQPRIERLDEIAKAMSISINFLQSVTPFEDLDFLDSFKAVVLASLKSKGMFNYNGRAVSEISDYEYWQCISDNIVSITRTSESELSIQYKENAHADVDHIRFVTGQLDVGAALNKFQGNKDIVYAYKVLNGLSTLNSSGKDKVLERIDELNTMEKYRL